MTSITSSQGVCTAEPGVITCLLGTLPVGGSAQVVVVLVAPASPGTALTNTATVVAAEPDVRPQDNGATSTTTVLAGPGTGPPATLLPDLVITKTVDRARATTADRVRYTITVQNRGAGAAENVVVTDTFNRAAVVVSTSTTAGSCTKRAPVVCTIGGLAAGGSVTIVIVVRPSASGTLSNTASVTSTGGVAAVAIASTRISQARARLKVTKTASRKLVPSGGVFVYTLRVRNSSSVAALDVRVCDVLPRGLTFVRTTSGAVMRGRRVCWRAGSLAAGNSRTFMLTVRADRADLGRSIVNTGHASADNARGVDDPVRIRVLAAGAGRAGGVTG